MMRNTQHACIGAIGLCLVATLAVADTIVLKDEVYVKGPKVLLGDVADIEGESRDSLAVVELASAALPGASRRFDASLVLSRVKSSGIDYSQLKLEGARRVSATTLHQDVSADMIAQSLRAYIEAEMPWDPLDTEVDVVIPAERATVEDGDLEIEWRPNPQYRYLGSGGFSGQILVDGHSKKTLRCRASVEPYVDVVVASYDIARAKPLLARDIEVQKRPLTSLRADAFQAIEELDGFVARTTIFPGQVLTTRNVTPRTIIRRNQVVIVQTQVGGLELETRARALSDACAGDLLICSNLESKQEFQGIALRNGVVVVP